MKKLINILVGVLALQVIIVAALNLRSSDLGAFHSQEKLLGVDLLATDKISIEEKTKPALVLEKKDGKWVLPAAFGFPASMSKFDQTLRKLADMTRSWPVGKTDDAARQFKLTDKDFERKITFSKGDKPIKILYLGSSPEFRKVHAKLSDDPLIYAINFSTFEATTAAADWLDKDLLKIEAKEIARIEVNSLVLKGEDGKFSVEGVGAEEEARQTEVDSLAAKVRGLAIQDVIGTEEPDAAKGSQPAYQFSLTTKSGEKRDYSFWGPVAETHYLLKVSTQPYYLKAAKAVVEEIKNLDRKGLIRAKGEQEAAPASAGTENSTQTPPASQSEQSQIEEQPLGSQSEELTGIPGNGEEGEEPMMEDQ